MIITRLHGRLGNQMFQYAAGAALAAREGVPLAIDTRRAIHKNEGVLTRVFDLPLSDPAYLPPAQHARPLSHALWRLIGRRPRFRRERGLGYNPAFETWGDHSYLHGYWQSETYFAPIAERIRKDFTFTPEMSALNREMATRIAAASQAVALHVRRGDYVALGASAACDQAYYNAALAAVTAGLEDVTVFVFSDDPAWARDNLDVPFNKVVVDFNGPESDYEDMRLMSLCDHNITANSSFSWWAAWLNRNPAKRVAAPARWVLNADQSNPDILPESWIAIDN
jgi:hypothetical protein